MPKKYSITKKREWLEQCESGDLEVDIAKRSKADVRTVRKGIELARREREAVAARTHLLIDSLGKHQKDLMGVVDDLLSLLVLPGVDLSVQLDEQELPEPISLRGVSARWGGGQTWKVLFTVEKSPLWELLQQHLKRDPMWRYLDDWKKALAAHLQARAALKRKAAQLLVEKTRCRLIGDNEAPKKRSAFRGTIDFLYRVALDQKLGMSNAANLSKVKRRITVTATGYVQYGMSSPILAYAPGEERKCRWRILRALTELCQSTEADDVSTTYKAMKDENEKGIKVLQEISLLRMVPGQCRVCRRLGV